MSHNRDNIIINRAPGSVTTSVVQSASIELQFPEGTLLETKLKKVRQVERMLDKLDHDDDD